ncbi:MAG TPA: lamin tail domain-containing protein [Galbitalea sp.]
MSTLSAKRLTRAAIVGIPVVALIGAGLGFAAPAAAIDTSSHVIISEVYGGGGNSGAPYNKDFIEIVNNGTTTADLTGWSVQYSSAAGTTWQATPLTGSVAAGGFYLVSESGGATGADLPTPNASGTLALSAASGKVALVSSASALSGCAATCDSAPGVVDFVGYGAANDAAGSPAPGLSNTTSDQRTSATANTGNNSVDFALGAPTPAASTAPPAGSDCSATPTPVECVPGTTTIQDVQGDGFKSPLVGDTVTKVPGVVTAVRSTGSSKGFWIQETAPDASRVSASSGVFVFTSSPTVTVGDDVLVTGKVSDFYTLSSGETVANTASLSTTEIAPTLVTTLSKANALPAPVILTPTTVPALYAPTTASGNVESITTVDPTHSALEFWEAHEGMRVEVDNARVVGPGDTQFGEIYVTTKPTEQATPRGGTYIPGYNSVPTGRVLVAPANGIVPPANVGDVLSGPTVGPVDWSTFGGYDIIATTVGSYQNNGLQPTAATAQATDQLAIATYNVENLAPTDPQSKYDALATGVVENLASPDVISVEEIQDNSGATDDGTVAADQTLTKFTAAISAAGGPSYQWSEIDPANDKDGGQPGGNIRDVFLYNPDRVSLDQVAGGSTTTSVGVVKAADGTADLTQSPGLVDPTNTAWTSSRKPLAAEFVFQGKKVIVVGNHFASKLGDQNSDGRFQPAARSSEIQRGEQAQTLNAFVKSVLAVDANANVVLAGDFNDYQFSPSITTLTDSGATLTDLITTLPQNQQYTYVFDGISQVLDHIFVSKALSSGGANRVQYDVIHVNSEFAAQASDHDPQVVRIRPVAATPPVANGTIQVVPGKVLKGTLAIAVLQGFDPRVKLSIAVDGAPATTTTTDKHGLGLAIVLLPHTAVGTHTMTATTPSGAVATTTFQVVTLGGLLHLPF